MPSRQPRRWVRIGKCAGIPSVLSRPFPSVSQTYIPPVEIRTINEINEAFDLEISQKELVEPLASREPVQILSVLHTRHSRLLGKMEWAALMVVAARQCVRFWKLTMTRTSVRCQRCATRANGTCEKEGENTPDELKSWKAISEYLHKPITTVKRWAQEGMPVSREGRFVTARKEELAKWLGEGDEVRGSVHVIVPGEDLTADLRKGLAAIRRRRR